MFYIKEELALHIVFKKKKEELAWAYLDVAVKSVFYFEQDQKTGLILWIRQGKQCISLAGYYHYTSILLFASNKTEKRGLILGIGHGKQYICIAGYSNDTPILFYFEQDPKNGINFMNSIW